MSLLHLPEELQLCVLEHLTDFSDCVSLSLASPRLGLSALHRSLPRFRDPLFAVAMRVECSRVAEGVMRISRAFLNPELLLRKYAADSRASAENFVWIREKSPEFYLVADSPSPGPERWLLERGSAVGEDVPSAQTALVRLKFPSRFVAHYEGDKGAERLVRGCLPDGGVKHFEGEKGGERLVRFDRPDGSMYHYDGEKGAERLVRVVNERRVFACYACDGGVQGAVMHFEGERGAERCLRGERLDGAVFHLEGDRGAERRVRVDRPDGTVEHYEGDTRGAERMVRVNCTDGSVKHFVGEKGAERWVRTESPGGAQSISTIGGEGGQDAPSG